MRIAARRALPATFVLVVMVAMTALGAAAPASAKLIHKLQFSFDGSKTPQGYFSSFGLAVDNSPVSASKGDVYVGDLFNERVDKFSVSGSAANYECQITGAGNNTTSPSECDSLDAGLPAGAFSVIFSQEAVDSLGNLYVADKGSGLVDEFSSTGKYLSQIALPNNGSPESVALDTTGNVFIADSANRAVEKFEPGTSSMSTFATGTPSGGFGTVSGVAVDDDVTSPAYGDVYVVDQGGKVVDVFDSTGKYLSQITGTPSGSFSAPMRVTVDPGSGEVYVTDLFAGVVDQFDATGAYRAQIQLPEGWAYSVAVDGSSGEVYVGNGWLTTIYAYGPTVVVPDVTTGAASNVHSTSATLNGMVNADGTALTSCQFEYVDEADYQSSPQNRYASAKTAACSSTPSGSSPQAVEAQLSGLVPGTVYRFRLQAANANGATIGEEQIFATGPVIGGEGATQIGATTATVYAAINPEGADTTYRFEYGTSPCAGGSCASMPAAPGIDIGSGVALKQVMQSLSDLAPGVTYYFRAIASSAVGTTESSDQTFTTAAGACPNEDMRGGLSSYLPDCRAYEQVSPENKEGADIFGVFHPTVAAENGERALYQASNGFGEVLANGVNPRFGYSAVRGSGGWESTSFNPPSIVRATDLEGSGILAGMTPNLELLVFQSEQPLAEGTLPRIRNLFLSGKLGSYTLLTTKQPPASLGESFLRYFYGPRFEGASRDFSHIVFSANGPLTENAPEGTNWHVYDSYGGVLRLLDILPNGKVSPEALVGGSSPWQVLAEHAVSADGSRVVFTTQNDGQIYMRENGTSTVEVSASHGGADATGAQPARYGTATPDDSKIFFTSAAALTPNANTGDRNKADSTYCPDCGQDLYEYDPESNTLTDLSVDANPADARTGANVQRVLGASSDGSYVYFVANGQPVEGKGASGANNVYLYHDGHIAFVARDIETGWGNYWRVTPDGLHLLFSSSQRLTGYDNTDALSGGPDREFFKYDAPAGTLTCVSCNPTGARPIGAASIAQNVYNGIRAMSDDGSEVFFETADALVPRDANGQTDVYEYSNGHVYLISAGIGVEPSYFQDASADGSNVFFTTRDRLVGQDIDENSDLYDARVKGGIASQLPPVPACSGEDCQPLPTTPPSLGGAATITFAGPGNLRPESAPSHKRKPLRHHKRKRKSRRHKRGKAHKSGAQRSAHPRNHGHGRRG